ncbi:hypothetical protein C2G38_2029097 [Gigaspora rosea]|uniref:Uncharacterized protein n=1 Tax=Gigaspora rosea TaxID=44941 RepID=A0A397TPN4_9GLOM|nr:hypothetical protein C2G38_2309063 [Gigaspora rosea]RIB27764.1 hypothetical protein C2G38_2029097 [Gigaspora rosea]
MLRLRDLVINPIKNSSKETITKVENMDKTTKFYQNAKISHRYRRNKAERDEKIKPSVRTGLRLMQISPEKVVQSMKKAGLRIIMVELAKMGLLTKSNSKNIATKTIVEMKEVMGKMKARKLGEEALDKSDHEMLNNNKSVKERNNKKENLLEEKALCSTYEKWIEKVDKFQKAAYEVKNMLKS